MRFRIAFFAVLTLAAADRGGCSPPDARAPVDDECAGLACGASCAYCPDGATQCPVPTFAPTACDARGACVTAGTFSCDPSACEGKKCGDECTIDPPCRSASPPCMMPTVLGYCDQDGQCTTASPTCAPYDPCAGKACHAPCQLCPPGDADCMETMVVKWCDGAGACVAQGTGAACPK